MPRITVAKNVNLYVEDWGAGKTIVFIHGWPFDHRIFEYQMVQLAKRDCRVVAVDLRGFGDSDKPWGGNDFDTWAIDIGKIIAQLILRDVTLVGFSMGGAIAAHYVSRRIDTRISKLALLASSPLTESQPEDKQGFEKQLERMLEDRPKFMSDHMKSLIYRPASAEYMEWLACMGRAASLRACVRGLEELKSRDIRPALANIRIPTRFFHGVRDKIVPISVAESQVSFIKGASLVRFEESGHAIFWDEKDRLVDELDRFAGEKLARAAA